MWVKRPPKKFLERLLKSQEGIAGNHYDSVVEQERLINEQIEWTLFAGRWRHRLHLGERTLRAIRARYYRWLNKKFYPWLRRIQYWTDRQIGRDTTLDSKPYHPHHLDNDRE